MTKADQEHQEWLSFLRSPFASSITPAEARMLQSLEWTNGRRPTENVYRALLAVIRQAPQSEKAPFLEPTRTLNAR